MSAIRLAQDQAQMTQAQQSRNATAAQQAAQQDSFDSQESEERRLQELEEKREASRKANQDQIKTALAKIRAVPQSLRRSQVTKKEFDKREDLIRAVKARNLRAYASIGITAPTSVSVGRQASGVISGKKAGRGKDARSQRDVSRAKLGMTLAAGKKILTPEEFGTRLRSIDSSFSAMTATEKRHTRYRSTLKAQGKSAKGVQQNFIAGSKFSTQAAPVTRYSSGELIRPTKIASTNTGSGTSSDPFRASQPNAAKVAPFIRAAQQKISATRGSGSTQPRRTNTIQDGSLPVQGPAPLSALSTVGYSPSGLPLQGPGRPEEFKGAVGPISTALGTADEKATSRQVSAKRRQEDFLSQLSADDKVKTFTARGSGPLESFYKAADTYGRDLDRQAKLFQKTKPGSIQDAVSGFNLSIYSQGAGALNLATQAGDAADKYILGRAVAEKTPVFIPKTVAGEYIGGTVEDVFKGKPLEGTGVARAQSQIKSQTPAQTGGQLAGDVIPIVLTGGASALKKAVGAGSKKIVVQTSAKTITGKTVKDAVAVSQEYRILGKPIITKTYDAPAVLKEVTPLALKQRVKAAVTSQPLDIKPKVSPVSTKGSFSFGGTDPKKVLSKTEIDPQGRGFELATGDKGQTRFNLKTLKELEEQGKISKRDVGMFETVSEGVKLVQKAPQRSFRAQTRLNALTPAQQGAALRSVGGLQSPFNWAKGQRRVGKVGGSFSQESQLSAKYRKQAIHDLDIDVRSTKIAERAAEKVYRDTSRFSTKEVKITLDGKKVKATTKSQEADEFAEFLDPKDAVKYQGPTVDTGLRFGTKFRDDKLSQYFKAPIKDPVSGLKIRSLKDQAIAKGASVLSLQGKSTEKFVGVPKPDQVRWVAQQNRNIDEGVLSVNPPALRGKDTIDLYKIFKSEAEGFKGAGKIKQGERLDFLAENLKKLNPGLDFDAKVVSGGSTFAPTSTSSAVSLTSAEARKGTVFTSAIPRVSQPKSGGFTESPSTRSVTSAKSLRSPSVTSVSPFASASTFSISSASKSFSVTPSRKGSSLSSSSKGSTRSSRSASLLKPINKSSRSIGSSKSSKRPTVSKSVGSKSVSASASKSVSASASVSRGSGKSFRGYGGLTGNVAVSVRPSPRKAVPFIIKFDDSTDRKKGKKKKSHDFLGNTRLDHIEGLFRRSEAIHGDKRLPKQIRQDSKKGFNQSKVRIF